MCGAGGCLADWQADVSEEERKEGVSKLMRCGGKRSMKKRELVWMSERMKRRKEDDERRQRKGRIRVRVQGRVKKE